MVGWLLKNVEDKHIDMKASNERKEKKFEEHTKRLKLHDTILRNIEIQLGQLAQELYQRPRGTLSSGIVTDPKGK